MSSRADIDLLGALAYGELLSFQRITADATIAPSLASKVELAKIAVAEYEHFNLLCQRLTELGADPVVAMQPFVAPLDQMDQELTPRDWLEGLLKVYVGEGIVADFYREMSGQLDVETAKLVEQVLRDVGHSEFTIRHIKIAIAEDAKVAGRLALWGRRLMGEMISQATLVSAARPELHTLFLDAVRAADDMSGLINRLTVGHARRMDAIGLAS